MTAHLVAVCAIQSPLLASWSSARFTASTQPATAVPSIKPTMTTGQCIMASSRLQDQSSAAKAVLRFRVTHMVSGGRGPLHKTTSYCSPRSRAAPGTARRQWSRRMAAPAARLAGRWYLGSAILHRWYRHLQTSHDDFPALCFGMLCCSSAMPCAARSRRNTCTRQRFPPRPSRPNPVLQRCEMCTAESAWIYGSALVTGRKSSLVPMYSGATHRSCSG